MPKSYAREEVPLPPELAELLAKRGVAETGEVALRRSLEALVPGYSLYRLTPAAAKRWKCRYRIMLDAGFFDGQSAAEAYARALLAVVSAPAADVPAPDQQGEEAKDEASGAAQ